MATIYLYVMGAGSGAGKSTVCLGILAQLLALGFKPQQLAYIKPVTQCIVKQPVARFCEDTGIAYRDIGKLVFTKGFSRDFIDGLTAPSDKLLADVLDSIRHIGKDKTVVIIDGVGDPSVGSVVAVSNVDVALALTCKVIFVGNPGIGAAIDNTVLCISFMHAKGLADIGVIYNKLPLSAFNDIQKYITKRLPELLPNVTLLGFIGKEDLICAGDSSNVAAITRWFTSYINPNTLLRNWLQLHKIPD